MKYFALILVVSLCVPMLVSGQSSKKQQRKINVTTYLNYFPSAEPYVFSSERMVAWDNIELTYLTQASGTLEVEEGKEYFLQRTRSESFLNQNLGLGAALQFVKNETIFQEIGITRLMRATSNSLIVLTTKDGAGNDVYYTYGFEDRATAFGLRYELGRYFGDKKAKVRWALSIGVEPTFYWLDKTSASFQDFSVKGRLVTLEVSAIPALTARLSKLVTVDIKAIPNFLLADFEKVREDNPTLPLSGRIGVRTFSLPEVNLALSLGIRCTIKDTKGR